MKFLLLLLLFAVNVQAQQKSSMPVPDLNALMKMTATQREAYKQKMLKTLSSNAGSISDEYHLNVSPTALPDFAIQAPIKDLQHLTALPKQPPTLIQLADGLRSSEKALQRLLPTAELEEVKNIIATQNAPAQQSASVAAFYSNKPAEALLLSMHSVLQNVTEPLAWNNLAALYNLSGLAYKAIPVLMTQLQSAPTNPVLLNNMGQAYLNLGDLSTARTFLQRCLAQDPMNTEANRSMGLINFFEEQFEEGQKYFEKELQLTHRRSTLALLKQKGKPANLYLLRQKRTDLPHRDYFEEINLSRFVLPPLPKNSDETEKAKAEAAGFLKSVAAEIGFWRQASTEPFTEVEKKDERYQNISVYTDLVNELLDGLKSTFPAENLSLFTTSDLNDLQTKYLAYEKKINEIQSPTPPANSSNEVWEAYQRKCCEMKKPILDAFIADYNAFVTNRLAIVQGRYKDYINSLISIIQLDPAPGYKRMVYATVQQYFNLLMTAWQSGRFLPPPEGCHSRYTAEEANDIIQSSRSVSFTCRSWLNLNINLSVASLKASCESYTIEGGEFFKGSYEKNFSTGTSTLSGGVGLDASFGGVVEAGASQMLYIAFDRNNRFSDFGLSGSANATVGWSSESLITESIGKLSGQIGAVNGGYSLGINSGFSGTVESKGILGDFVKLEYDK